MDPRNGGGRGVGGGGYDDPILMPPDHLLECAGRVAWYVAGVTSLHLVIYLLLQMYSRYSDLDQRMKKQQKESSESVVVGGGGGGGQGEESTNVLLANSFQLTNLLVNAYLGCVGIYYWFSVLPGDCSDAEKAMGGRMVVDVDADGNADADVFCDSPGFFSEFQLGYQIWSFPLCILIAESFAMMVHHVFVAVLGALSISLVLGFQYHTVFFMGVVEISSVFLSVMNAFKSRPYWIKTMPTCYACVKLLFSASFFCTRVIMWIPQMYDFYRIAWGYGTARGEENGAYHLLLVASLVPTSFLTFLQLFWATLIVRGLMKMAGIGGEEEKDK